MLRIQFTPEDLLARLLRTLARPKGYSPDFLTPLRTCRTSPPAWSS
jgi:hypothetical protein